MRRLAILLALELLPCAACSGKSLAIGDHLDGAVPPSQTLDGAIPEAQAPPPTSFDSGWSEPPCGGQQGLTVLASGQSSPTSIAVDATHVYWTNQRSGGTGGSVAKVPLCGGTVTTIASGPEVYPQFIPGNLAVDATNVYWNSASLTASTTGLAGVMMVPLGGGTPVTLASSPQLAGIGLGGGALYWAEGPGDPDASPSTSLDIRRISPGGGSPSTVVSGVDAFSLVVGATALYWSDGAGAGGGIRSVPLEGGTPRQVVSLNGVVIQAIAVDATNVYWTASESVMKAPLSGNGPTTVLAVGQSNPRQLVSDGSSVYWANVTGTGAPGQGSVMKVPVAGGATTTLASSQDDPQGLVLDATSIYWVNVGSIASNAPSGTVMKLTPR